MAVKAWRVLRAVGVYPAFVKCEPSYWLVFHHTLDDKGLEAFQAVVLVVLAFKFTQGRNRGDSQLRFQLTGLALAQTLSQLHLRALRYSRSAQELSLSISSA